MRFAAIGKVLLALLLLVLGGGIFLSTMPISFVLDKVQLPKELEVNSVTGSIWSGQMQAVWRSKPPVNIPGLNKPLEVLWKWCPSIQPIRMCIAVDSSEVEGDGYFIYALTSRTIAITDTVLRIHLEDYPFRYKRSLISISGNGEFSVHDFSHKLGQPLPDNFTAGGTITSLTNNDIEVGNYKVNLALQDRQLDVNTTGGTDIFSVEGKLEVDLGDRRPRYRYFADLSSDNKILIAALKAYAQNSGKGKVTFSGSGVM